MMPRTFYFISVTVLVFLIAGSCTQERPSVLQGGERPSAGAVDSLLQAVREQHNMPAMAAVVVRSDAIVASAAAGVRRLGAAAHVSAHDQFHLGSNTKAMTATIVALLVEEGKLSWSTTPREVFPELSGAIDPAFRDVTLEQLLAHRAGLQPFTDTREYAELPAFEGTPKEQRAAFATYVLQREPAHAPDSAFVYSNAGYGVAAAMAEQVSGVSWEEMMRSRLFEPLDIHGGFGWPATSDSMQPWGHRHRRGALQPQDPNGPNLGPLIAPAGDVHMSMPDYGRFLQLHLRGLRGEEPTLLSPSTIQYMHRSQGGMTDPAELPGYGLGWVVQEIAGERSSGHAGSVGSFKARAVMQPSRDLAVAVVANAGDDASDAATIELRDALLNRYRPDGMQVPTRE